MSQPEAMRSRAWAGASPRHWRAGGGLTRRRWLGLALLGRELIYGAGDPVSVLYRSGTEAFTEAVEALRKRVEGGGCVCHLLDLAGGGEAVAKPRCKVLVAMGGEALEKAGEGGSATPVIASMALRTEIERRGAKLNVIGRVALDIAPQTIAAELAGVLGGKVRLAMIRNRQGGRSVEWGGPGKKGDSGANPQMVDCAKPEDLLPTFLSLRDKADAVIAAPDAVLYNSATVKPLILASLENRLPIVGFSSSFVRAGAAIGVYPDFREVGTQTGEMAMRALAGEALRDEGPRRLVVGINPKVVRLLGLNIREPRTSELVVVK